MNDYQKVCVFLGVVACIALCLNPPWLGKASPDSPFQYVGHRGIPTGPSISVLDRHAYQQFAAKTLFGHRPHWTRLGVELSALVFLTTALVALLRTRPTTTINQRGAPQLHRE